MSQTTTEAIARIIDPRGFDNPPFYKDSRWEAHQLALTKATAILALVAPGEEFLEFKEALSDLRSLRHEYECLDRGPDWLARNKAAWDRIDELFANEDDAAYDRQQEDARG